MSTSRVLSSSSVVRVPSTRRSSSTAGATKSKKRKHVSDDDTDPQHCQPSYTGFTTTLVPAQFPIQGDEPQHPQHPAGEVHSSDISVAVPLPTPINQNTRQGDKETSSPSKRRRVNSRDLDDGQNPFVPPEKGPSTAPPHSELYPAYSANGERTGLEHSRGTAPRVKGNYYHPRVYKYDRARGSAPLPPLPQQVPRLPVITISTPTPEVSTLAEPTLNPDLIDPALGSAHIASNLVLRYGGKTIHELLGLKSGAEISMDSLPDPEPGEKPDYTYQALVKLAIWSSPDKRLTLQGIYDTIEARFEWYRTREDDAWKKSIRHCLSLMAVFQKFTRPMTDPGKGCYWVVDWSKGDGNKRVRKRNKRSKKDSAGQSKVYTFPGPGESFPGTSAEGTKEPETYGSDDCGGVQETTKASSQYLPAPEAYVQSSAQLPSYRLSRIEDGEFAEVQCIAPAETRLDTQQTGEYVESSAGSSRGKRTSGESGAVRRYDPYRRPSGKAKASPGPSVNRPRGEDAEDRPAGIQPRAEVASTTGHQSRHGSLSALGLYPRSRSASPHTQSTRDSGELFVPEEGRSEYNTTPPTDLYGLPGIDSLFSGEFRLPDLLQYSSSANSSLSEDSSYGLPGYGLPSFPTISAVRTDTSPFPDIFSTYSLDGPTSFRTATDLDEGQSEPGHRNLTDLDAVDASLLYKERVLRGPEDEGSDK